MKSDPVDRTKKVRPPRAGMGRPKGSKNKATLVKEAMMGVPSVISGQEVRTPLAVLMSYMLACDDEYKRLVAEGPPDDPEKIAEWGRSVRHARRQAADFAIAAAPFVHSKLQSVDKTVKKGVVIQVKKYEFVAPKPAPKAGK